MTTPAERRAQVAKAQARRKARKKAEGKVRLELWVHKDDVDHIKNYASLRSATTEAIHSFRK